MELARPFPVRTVTLSLVGNFRFGLHGELQVSQDGSHFQTVREFDGQPPTVVLNLPQTTTARWFRVQFSKALHPKLDKIKIAELELSPGMRIENLSPKAAIIPAQFTPLHNLPMAAAWPALPRR